MTKTELIDFLLGYLDSQENMTTYVNQYLASHPSEVKETIEFKPKIVKVRKHKFDDSDTATSFYLKLRRLKFKVEEPKNKHGLCDCFLIHLDTIEQQVVFHEKFLKFTDVKETERSCRTCANNDCQNRTENMTDEMCMNFNLWKPITTP